MHLYNFFVCGPKFTNFFSSDVGGIVVDQILFRFLIVDAFRRYSLSNSKVVKNRAEFRTYFLPSQILGGGPSKNCTHVITPASRHVACSGCALARLGQSLARVKIWGRSTPYKGRNIASRKMSTSVGHSICTSIAFSYVDQSSQLSSSNVGGVVVD